MRCLLLEHPQSNWTDLLPMVEFAINGSFQASSGCTPHEVVFGTRLRSPVDHLAGVHPVQAAQDAIDQM